MSDAGLNIIVGANVSQAISGIGDLKSSLVEAEAELARLGLAIDHAIDKGADITALENSFQKVSDRVKALRAQLATPITVPPVDIPAPNDGALLNSIAKQRVAFIDLGRIVTGQGFSLRALASNFTLFSPAVVIAAAAIALLAEAFLKQSDAEKKAAEDAKKLKEFLLDLKSVGDITETATGSEAGNIARVRALADAIQDTNKTYKERNTALLELQKTNKSYFGDLTLEAASLQTLSGRVTEYSKALITEAIVKGNVDEIAKVSSELNKQVRAYDELKDAQQRAQKAFDEQGPAKSSAGNVAGGGDDELTDPKLAALDEANNKLKKQAEVVLQLRTAVASYTGELQNNLAEQIKLKPLDVIKPPADTIKGLESILQKIKEVKAELAKKEERPEAVRFAQSVDPDLVKSYQVKIAAAIEEGNKIGTADSRKYAEELAGLYVKALSKLQNPNLHTIVEGISPSDVHIDQEKLETEISRNLDKAKALHLTTPVEIELAIQDVKGFDEKDSRIIKQALDKDPILAHQFILASADLKLSIGRTIISAADVKKLRDTIRDNIGGVAESAFKDIGTSIGDLLSGQKSPFQKAVKDFTTVLGNGLIAIGEQMIVASTLMQALKTSLGGLFENPAGALVEGIAAVALGEVVKNVGAKAFATGGIVTGPTLGLVGEAGPEVIFPLDRLNSFVKSNTGNAREPLTGKFRIAGRDLALVLGRDGKNQGLV